MIQGSYELTHKDIIEAFGGHAGTMVVLIRTAVGICFIAEGLLLLFMRRNDPFATFLVPLIFFLVGAYLVLVGQLVAWQQYRKVFSKFGPVEIGASDEAIYWRSRKGNAEVLWNGLERHRETKNLFLIYPQSNLFYIVPKRAFPDNDEAVLRELLQQHLGSKSQAFERKLRLSRVIWVVLLLIALATVSCTVLLITRSSPDRGPDRLVAASFPFEEHAEKMRYASNKVPPRSTECAFKPNCAIPSGLSANGFRHASMIKNS